MNAPAGDGTFVPSDLPRIVAEDDDSVSILVTVKKATLRRGLREHGYLLGYLLEMAREP